MPDNVDGVLGYRFKDDRYVTHTCSSTGYSSDGIFDRVVKTKDARKRIYRGSAHREIKADGQARKADS